jgi:hypothetical protein
MEILDEMVDDDVPVNHTSSPHLLTLRLGMYFSSFKASSCQPPREHSKITFIGSQGL